MSTSEEAKPIIAVGGPMFERADQGVWQSVHNKDGAHYNVFASKRHLGMDGLRQMFPKGACDEMNFVLFSTSGIHGCYTTIEDIEAGLTKYGDAPDFGGNDWPDDYSGNSLTFLIVQPRIVCMRYGTACVTLADIQFLKNLRETSLAAVKTIGFPGS